MSKDVSSGYKTCSRLCYIGFTGIGAPGQLQAPSNFNPKPSGWCSGHGNKMVMLRRGLCGLLNLQTHFHVRQHNSDALELEILLMNSGRIQNYSLRTISFISPYDQQRIISWSC